MCSQGNDRAGSRNQQRWYLTPQEPMKPLRSPGNGADSRGNRQGWVLSSRTLQPRLGEEEEEPGKQTKHEP
jgi:hypothetical protein